MLRSLVGSEMCIRDRHRINPEALEALPKPDKGGVRWNTLPALAIGSNGDISMVIDHDGRHRAIYMIYYHRDITVLPIARAGNVFHLTPPLSGLGNASKASGFILC